MMAFAYWELSCLEETQLHVLAAGEVQMESDYKDQSVSYQLRLLDLG